MRKIGNIWEFFDEIYVYEVVFFKSQFLNVLSRTDFNFLFFFGEILDIFHENWGKNISFFLFLKNILLAVLIR